MALGGIRGPLTAASDATNPDDTSTRARIAGGTAGLYHELFNVAGTTSDNVSGAVPSFRIVKT